MAPAPSSEEGLRKRFNVARLIIDGHNNGEPLPASEIRSIAGISLKTHQRDIRRAREALTFEEWAPKKRGPPEGTRRVSPEITALALELVYERRKLKRNVAKAARDLRSRALRDGRSVTFSTAKRLIGDIYAGDQAFFRAQEMGREGERLFELQRGQFAASEPLEVVFIDHTPLDVRHWLFRGQELAFRPTLTTASDLYSGALLAGFASLFPPCRTTVALAMAMLTSDKSSILKEYGVPGAWECGGIPRTIMVDGAKEFAREEFAWVCQRYDIDLIVGGYGPERRSPHERIFRTLNSDIHSWPGTTLSNTVELKKHGGTRPVELDFRDVQYRLLLAIMEYNHETYEGYDPAPIAAWRAAIDRVPFARRPLAERRHVFFDFLPSEERDLTSKGISFEACAYRGSELQKLRYESVKKVRFHYDPRAMRQIYIPVPDERRYVAVNRVSPPDAPDDQYLLRLYNKHRRASAEASRDAGLLAELEALKNKRPRYFDFDDTPYEANVAPAPASPSRLPVGPMNPALRQVSVSERSTPAAPDAPLPPLQIPDFPSRLK